MITLTKVNCKPTYMNLEDEGRFPVEKDFQDSLNVFYVNEVFISLIRRDGLRGLSKIEKIFDHFTLYDDLQKMAVGGIQG